MTLVQCPKKRSERPKVTSQREDLVLLRKCYQNRFMASKELQKELETSEHVE